MLSDVYPLDPSDGKQQVFHAVDRIREDSQLNPVGTSRLEAEARDLRVSSRPPTINDRNSIRSAIGGESPGVSGVPLVKVKLKAGAGSPKLELPFLLFPPKFTIAELTQVTDFSGTAIP